MLQSSFAVAFLALAAVPGTLAGWNGHATIPATKCYRNEISGCASGRCLNGNCVRSCAAGEEQGCPTLCKKLTMPEGWCAANNSGACWCTRDDTKSFIDADRPVDDKRDEIKTYRETKA
ncbi:uncharacterized protein BDZ83DRAFT_708104 [Colletotrichum acutatum]|uniref:Uncharacterized protein n=1 Tax=Glomerella acutata TaxID=27357 RepID=A0AAD8UH06_GLOAC|nr:uncharacterized protein BDZ83DRAFT_708104 [Colletotrichum acutatum]KAK1716106.1 hypothetical protein BDZ83DRAFT_708104 [Colletotrichum acutatum]